MSAEHSAVRYERLETLVSSPEADLTWLTGKRERAERDRLTAGTRRDTWAAGRILCRRLLRDCGLVSDSQADGLQILSRNELGQSDRPTVFLHGVRHPVWLSISHSSRGALVALSTSVRVGVDLVDLQQLPKGSLWIWLTAEERAWIPRDDFRQQATVWAIKEAVYKAVNTGDAFAPAGINIFSDGSRYTCAYRGRLLASECTIQVREIDGHLTAVAESLVPPEIPSNPCVDHRQKNESW